MLLKVADLNQAIALEKSFKKDRIELYLLFQVSEIDKNYHVICKNVRIYVVNGKNDSISYNWKY